ncbi:MAG TPA: hypothetical protein VFE32_12055 [Puia sp.]|jgi:hypothetical protein|nr:hypothetical protein [Puia sp.]
MRIEILKYLSDSYSYKPLNEFFKKNFSDASLGEIATVLDEMYNQEPSLIRFRDDPEYKLLNKSFYYFDTRSAGYYKGPPDQPHLYIKAESTPTDPKEDMGTLDNLNLEARITEKGRKELEEYELRESIRTVNQSVIKTNKTTLIIASLAAVFSLLSLIVPLWKSDKLSIPQLEETNRQMQMQWQALDSIVRVQSLHPMGSTNSSKKP